MFRVVLAGVFLILSSGLIWLNMTGPNGATLREVLGDLGTEMFGILVTIALVDWVLERRRKQDRAREVAWGALAEVQHAIWVWQGGARQQGTGDLLGVISGIEEEHALEPVTEALLLSVAFHAKGTLQTEATALKSLQGLHEVFEELNQLSSIEGLRKAAKVRVAVEVLSAAVLGLARALGEPTEWMPSGLIWDLDPTSEGQAKRHEQAWALSRGGLGHSIHRRW